MDGGAKVLFQLGCQPGSPRLVISLHAVLDRNVHAVLPATRLTILARISRSRERDERVGALETDSICFQGFGKNAGRVMLASLVMAPTAVIDAP